ncbi:FAD-binding oxidoreductase [Rickettsiales bacterium LUAb2]
MLDNLNTLKQHLKDILTNEQIISDEFAKKVFTKDKRGNFNSSCAFVVLPNNVDEVSAVVKLCNKFKVSIVPQSGNTGLVGGSVAKNDQIILNLQNLSNIRNIDPINQTITLEAGITLDSAITAAKKYNLLFPLDLPSRANAKIGGNLGSNAGGLNTIKYGTVKSFTLGLEVVLADGTIVSDLNSLTKRNIGPDYKNLFIGSEGTLGIITAACFKLFPTPKNQAHILFSSQSIEDIITTYLSFKTNFHSQISAFEVINNLAVNISLNQYKSFFPLNTKSPWYGLISLDFYNDISKDLITNELERYLTKLKLVNNFYLEINTKKIWDFRDLMSDAQKQQAPSLKHDVAVPLSNMAQFIKDAITAVYNVNSILRPVIFGHIGDQSLHFNFTIDDLKDSKILNDLKPTIKDTIVKIVMEYNGSFSAEHGIGLINIKELEKYYFNNQVYMIKLLKKMLDPTNIFNPHKVIS